MEPVSKALKYARDHRDRFLADLDAFLRIPSVSDDPLHEADVKRAAEWVSGKLRGLNLGRVEVFPTEGHPIVYAETAPTGSHGPSVLVYGHCDVQSPMPIGDWDTEPFVPVTRGDNLYARGASDMKGQILACVSALEAVMEGGACPPTVKFLIEGEEEIGSPHLGDFINSHRDMLACEFCLNPDAGMLGPDCPTIVWGLRGMVSCVLRVKGPAKDLHSGGFGGVVHNPVHALCALIGGLHDAEGRVALPGYYEKVRALAAEERAELAGLPLDELSFLKESGVRELWGEPGYTALERTAVRPALDVVQIRGGGPKSAIPAEAEALVTMRLVPDQDPAEARDQLVSYLEREAPRTVSWELEECQGFPPSLVGRSTRGVEALARALEAVWGRRPAFHRGGGSIPVVGTLQEVLGVDSVLTGFSLPGDSVHGPNEKLHLPTWERGVAALVRFFCDLAGQAGRSSS